MYPAEIYEREARECLWCGEVITHRHGNARFCSEEHKRRMAMHKSKTRNENSKEWREGIQKNERLLQVLFNQGHSKVSREFLKASQFNFHIFSHQKRFVNADITVTYNGKYGLFQVDDDYFEIIEDE